MTLSSIWYVGGYPNVNNVNKHDNSDISRSEILWDKLTSDSDSARQNMSKNMLPEFFPRLFSPAKIFG